jgi:hypothetical protein
MYYGYRCYNKNHEPLGWLYRPTATEITWTDKNLHWCKRWKKHQTAEKYFDSYNSRWQFMSKGGYLKIEAMPEIGEPESAASRKQKLLEEWGVDNEIKTDKKISPISFTPTPELIEWLNEERCEHENDADLINRKLTKLIKLEREGH